MKKTTSTLAALTDQQILQKGDRAVRSRHELAIELLDCLIEIERRELYLKEGYPSLFAYCTERWDYSPPKAGRTIAAARCVRDHPSVRALLVERKITTCGVSRIAGILTEENDDKLLEQVSGKKYVEIDRIAASYRAAPAVREVIRPIGTKRRTDDGDPPSGEDLFRTKPEQATTNDDSQIDSIHTHPERGPAPPAACEERFEIRFSASEKFIRKLEKAKAVCSRSATLEAVLEKALDELLDRHDPERRQARREKRKSTKNARACNRKKGPTGTTPKTKNDKRSTVRSRHIPAALRDAVFARDGGRCTFVGKDGVRCSATTHLQIDHIQPFSRGGPHALENLRLLCGKHNRLLAREGDGITINLIVTRAAGQTEAGGAGKDRKRSKHSLPKPLHSPGCGLQQEGAHNILMNRPEGAKALWRRPKG